MHNVTLTLYVLNVFAARFHLLKAKDVASICFNMCNYHAFECCNNLLTSYILVNFGWGNALVASSTPWHVLNQYRIIVDWTLRTNFREVLVTVYTFHSQKCIWTCHPQNHSHFFRPQCVCVFVVLYVVLFSIFGHKRRTHYLCMACKNVDVDLYLTCVR